MNGSEESDTLAEALRRFCEEEVGDALVFAGAMPGGADEPRRDWRRYVPRVRLALVDAAIAAGLWEPPPEARLRASGGPPAGI